MSDPDGNCTLAAFHYDDDCDYSFHLSVFIKKINQVCTFYGALKFKKENLVLCCADGKVKLPELHLPPKPLSTIVSGDTSPSKQFIVNIWKYNSCFYQH